MIAMHMTVYLSAAAKKTSLKSGLAPQSELNAEQQLTCNKYNKQIYNMKILQTVQIDS
jgi:hypothetical protein